MRRRITALAAFIALASTVAGISPAASHAATALDGAWTGGGRALQISGTLEGGFSIAAGESWSIIGCPITAGTRLSSYSPKGGGAYDATYLWTEAENGVCSNSYRGPETVTVTGTANALEISGCGYALCGSFTRVSGPGDATTPGDSGQPPAKADTSRPRVRAFTREKRAFAGKPTTLDYSVSDDSGGATVHLTVYQGGTEVLTVTRQAKADGRRRSWKGIVLPADLIGPMFYCVWAQDAAGNRSANAPRSKCGWISMGVPIGRVSNTCGGAGWDAIVAIQNYFGNEHTYRQSAVRSYTVNFADACNIHDAAYGGHTVWDRINSRTIDFRSWSRPSIDRKFLEDMRKLCRREIPEWASRAREKCVSRGGTLSIGARTLYDFVDRHGWRFFDADLTTPGIQRTGHRRQFD